MEQLYNLFNAILAESKGKKVSTCEELLSSQTYYQSVKNILKYLGFKIDTLDKRGISILFFSLVDILIVVNEKDNSYYFATSSQNQIESLRTNCCLLPRSDESASFEKTYKIIQGNTVASINEYLAKDKFKLIKLVHEETTKFSKFLCRLTTMNPYPDLKNEKVYCLSELATKYNKLANLMIQGFYTIKTKNGYTVAAAIPRVTDGKALNKTCTSCFILGKSVDNTLVQIPFWEIEDYDKYEPNELIRKLQNGIYILNKKGKKDNKQKVYVTLNREILMKYYGEDYYRVESLGVRQRYAFEEMLGIGSSLDISYYYKKYHFYSDQEMRNITNYTDLYEHLQSKFIEQNVSQFNGHIHPRVLGSVSSILSGYQSLYMTVKMDDTSYELEEVDADKVLPKLYYVSGISVNYGYNVVQIESAHESSVEELGKKEFIRQFGDIQKVLSIFCVKTNTYIKGKYTYSISIDTQRQICQNMMYGYSSNYSGYAKLIKEVCISEKVLFEVTDDMIQYLFVNGVARVCKKSGDLTLDIVSHHLVMFLDTLQEGKDSVLEKLKKEWCALSKRRLKSYYDKIEDMISNGSTLDDIGKVCKLEPTAKGYNCYTQYGMLSLSLGKDKKLTLSKNGVVFHGSEEIGNVRF